MARILVAVLLLTVAFVDDAEACKCVGRSFAEHAKTEKRVFLARAGKQIKSTTGALEQPFTILATLKGPDEKTFTWKRSGPSPCEPTYAENDLALIFSTDGEVDLCHGNMSWPAQLEEFGAIVNATKTPRKAADAIVLAFALRAAVAKFLHDRPRIGVKHAALAGKSFTIDKSKLVYEKTANKDSIVIAEAFAAGKLAYVRGGYKREGVVFEMLMLLGDDGSWTMLESIVAET
jgi:hypothetical protein